MKSLVRTVTTASVHRNNIKALAMWPGRPGGSCGRSGAQGLQFQGLAGFQGLAHPAAGAEGVGRARARGLRLAGVNLQHGAAHGLHELGVELRQPRRHAEHNDLRRGSSKAVVARK